MQIHYLSNSDIYTGLSTDYPGPVAPYNATAVPLIDSCDGYALKFDRATQTWGYIPLSDLVPPPPPPPTVEELQAMYTVAIQKRLDDWAKTRNYDSILSACTYATSANPRFSAEGQRAVENRDATWDTGYAIVDDVLSGKRPVPTIEEVMAELPPLKWPDEV